MDASAKPGCPFRVCVVISATPGHGALDRAIRAGVSSEVIDACALGEGFETALLDALRRYAVEAVALAGFMRRLSPEFVARYPNRILNVHPALLPSFGGRGMYGERVHKAVLAHGVKVTGCTVHFVDAEYDHGPIILQKAVAVMEDDTPKTLGIRVLVHEHSAYLHQSGNWQKRDQIRLQVLLRGLLEKKHHQEWEEFIHRDEFQQVFDQVIERELAPHAAAERLYTDSFLKNSH